MPDALTLKLPKAMHRAATLEQREADKPLVIAISSEAPVERWYGTEILDHSPKALDLKRLKDRGLPLLMDHDLRKVVGRIEEIRLGEDKVLRGSVRFADSPEGVQAEKDMRAGIRPDISVGYSVDEVLEDVKASEFRAVHWRPLEASSVAVPADETVGVGRAAERTGAEVDVPLTRTGGIMPDNDVKEPEVRTVKVNDPAPERERVTELLKLGAEFGMDAGKWITQGASVQDATREVLAAHRAKAEAAEKVANKPPLTEKEEQRYSLQRAMRVMADAAINNRPIEPCFELEVSEHLHKVRDAEGLKSMQGIPARFAGIRGMVIPNLRANLVVGTGTLGGNLRFTEEGDLIEQLRAMTIVGKVGARFLTGLQGNILMPRQTAGGTAYWLAEAGTVTAGDIKWDTVTLSPKTLMYDYVASRQLLAQAAKDVEGAIRDDFVQSKAREIDRVFAIGTSTSNEPTGFVNVSGAVAKTLGTDGGAITWAHITAMEATAAQGNAVLDETAAYITNPKVANDAKNKFKSTAAVIPIWEGNLLTGNVNGYRGIISTTAPSNLTKGTSTTICSLLAFISSGREAMFGQWGGGGFAEMIVDPYSLKKTGLIEFTTFDLLDIQWRHGAGIVYTNDVTTAL